MKYTSILRDTISATEDINSDITLVKEAKALQKQLMI